ncbi:hypothetical protein BJX96DRAFT_176592 [Aspergillus floccosus]
MDNHLRLIWSKRLGLGSDEIEDDMNFFDLDGDSLRALQIVADAAAQGILLNVEKLYTHPTIGALSPQVSYRHEQSTTPARLSIDHQDASIISYPKSLIPLAKSVAPVLRNQDWWIGLHESGKHPLCVYVYEIQGIVNEAALMAALNVLSAKHATLRTTWARTSTGYCQVLLPDAAAHFSTTTVPVEDHIRQAKATILSPDDQIIRHTLVHDPRGFTYLTMAIPHAFTDSVSRSLLEQDLIRALKTPEEVRCDPVPPWLGAFARYRQATYSKEDESQYWRRYIEGASTELFYHKPSEAQGSGIVGHVVETVPVDSSHQVGISAVIVTAWCLALTRHSGLRDFGLVNLTMGRKGSTFPGIDHILGPLAGSTLFRFRLEDTHCPIRSILRDVNRELISHGGHEFSPLAVPPAGVPTMQCLLNIKLGSRTVPPSKVGDMTVCPRRDLESWDFMFPTGVYLRAGPDPAGMCFRMTYQHRHIGDQQAQSLFADFLHLLQHVGGEGYCVSQLVMAANRSRQASI